MKGLVGLDSVKHVAVDVERLVVDVERLAAALEDSGTAGDLGSQPSAVGFNLLSVGLQEQSKAWLVVVMNTVLAVRILDTPGVTPLHVSSVVRQLRACAEVLRGPGSV